MGPVIRRVLLYLAYLAAVIIIISAIVVAFRSGSDDIKTESGQTSQEEADETQSTQGGSSQGSTTSTATGTAASTTGQSTATNTATATTATSQAGTSQQLANSGPGEVVSLFVVSSLVGFTIYRYALVRRTTSN